MSVDQVLSEEDGLVVNLSGVIALMAGCSVSRGCQSGSWRRIHEAIREATVKHVKGHVLHLLHNDRESPFHVPC